MESKLLFEVGKRSYGNRNLNLTLGNNFQYNICKTLSIVNFYSEASGFKMESIHIHLKI